MKTNSFSHSLAALVLAGLASAGAMLQAASTPNFKDVEPDQLKLRRYVEPQFPVSLRVEALMEGYSQIVMLVNKDGRITESFVTDFSHPAFVTATTRATNDWEFLPSTDEVRRVCLRFDFRREGVVVSTTTIDEVARRLSGLGGNADEERSYTLGELDQTPAPVVINTPSFPASMQKSGKSGLVHVSFYIDIDGSVQVPSSVTPEFPEFGAAAVAAVRTWKFQPPLRNGRPVRVFVVQEFGFGLPRRTPAATATP